MKKENYMTHYENIRRMTVEQMAVALTSVVVGALDDVDVTEIPDIYADMLKLLNTEVPLTI